MSTSGVGFCTVDEGLYFFCVHRHVSDPQSNMALTVELNIFSLVFSLIWFAFLFVLNIMNATLAFCDLALMSSSMRPYLLLFFFVC